MGEETPPEKYGNMSNVQDDPDSSLRTAVTTANQPDATNSMANESRSLQNGSAPDDAPPLTPNARKYRIMFEDMRQRFNELQKTCDDKAAAHEKLIEEKNATIDELNNRLAKHAESQPYVMKMCNEDIFVSKQRKGAKGPTKACEISGCDNSDVDLIKCNMCGSLACEDCSDTKISKLRPLMNQCKTLYFTCPSCDVQIRDKSDVNAYDLLKEKVDALSEELGSCETTNVQLTQQVKSLDEQQTSLKQLLEERENSLQETETKLVSMEQNADAANNEHRGTANIEELISRRFDNIDKNIDALIEKKLAGVLVLPPASSGSGSDDNRKSFAAAVGGSSAASNHVSELKTSRNAELIEKQEQERRMNNIIIHGISEETAGENSNSEESHDQNFIKSFLEAIEVDVTPKQVLRLGRLSPDKKRPVKVILNNAEDKENIMSGLRKLKNADPTLRGISVRDDYTLEERKLIKTMSEEATRRNEADNVTHWKVRGTPKNGLRVVKITARN